MPVDLQKVHFHMQQADIFQAALKRADKMMDRKHYVLFPDGSKKLMHRDEISKQLDTSLAAAREAGGEAGIAGISGK